MNAQQHIARAVAERGYRDGWTAGQFAFRQILKLAEELGELAETCRFTVDDKLTARPRILHAITAMGHRTRRAFDANVKPSICFDVEQAKRELADIQVVVFALAEALEELSGEPFDVAQAAAEKAEADTARGVR